MEYPENKLKEKFNCSNIDFSKTVYKEKRYYIFCCLIHGEFKRRLDFDGNGYLCSKCYIKDKVDSNIRDCIFIHGNFYEYDFVDYESSVQKILCPIHGIFELSIPSHKRGIGCAKCYFDSKRMSQDEFESRANKVHNFKYSYLNTTYFQQFIKIEIECRKHGLFKQTPESHLRGYGCPNCNLSKGEKYIKQCLEESNIEFRTQETIKYMGKNYRFDFYIPKLDLYIEYDGMQHFEKVPFSRNNDTEEIMEERLKKVQATDKIKNELVKNLFRIKYTQFDSIPEIIEEKINAEYKSK